MKKHCTSTNAITIEARITCPTAEILATPSCINPVVYVLNEALQLSKKNNTTVVAEITSILNTGFLISNTGKFCCPECDDLYFLGGGDLFINAFPGDLIYNRNCCYNYVGQPSFIQNNIIFSQLTCCSTNFVDCVTAINQDLTDADVLFLGNLMEYNLINGESSLCLIYNQLKAFNKYLSPADLSSILTAITTLGLVVKCDGCNVFVGSMQSYINTY